jgi:hypothetical protein
MVETLNGQGTQSQSIVYESSILISIHNLLKHGTQGQPNQPSQDRRGGNPMATSAYCRRVSRLLHSRDARISAVKRRRHARGLCIHNQGKHPTSAEPTCSPNDTIGLLCHLPHRISPSIPDLLIAHVYPSQGRPNMATLANLKHTLVQAATTDTAILSPGRIPATSSSPSYCICSLLSKSRTHLYQCWRLDRDQRVCLVTCQRAYEPESDDTLLSSRMLCSLGS